VLSLIATQESPLTPRKVISTPSLFAATGEPSLDSEVEEDVIVVVLFPLEIIPIPKITKAKIPAATPPSAFHESGLRSFFAAVALVSFNKSLIDLLKGIVCDSKAKRTSLSPTPQTRAIVLTCPRA
jgi:hypothetical protein